MLFLRVALLEILVCLHVIGGALLFRRFFPRESAWWGFFFPTLAIVALLNFVEHFIALPTLAWLLPLTLVATGWAVARAGHLAKRLRLPGILFMAIFTFAILLKCVEPDVNFYNTEGLTDLTRILDFCLGDKLPAQDSWLPPYDHGGYYTFMHYGASVLKRLFLLDIGTAYNLGLAFTSTLVVLALAAAGFSLSRGRRWVAVMMVLVAAGAFTGSLPIHALHHPFNPEPVYSIDVGNGDMNDKPHEEFNALLATSPDNTWRRIFTPGIYLYYSEFHATIGGHLIALLGVFAVAELLRRKRADLPWIYLLIAPFLAVITCPWFIFIMVLLSWPSLILAWALGRHPARWRFVLCGTLVGMALIWPALDDLSRASISQQLLIAWDFPGDFWTFVIQWWPIYVPWFALCFAWPKMSGAARWLHFLYIPILLMVEMVYFTDRTTTLEKTWGGTFGVGLACLYPVVLIQKAWPFRALSVALIAAAVVSFSAWTETSWMTYWPPTFLHLQGDSYLTNTPQLNRMRQVLARIRGQTVLTGKAPVAWFENPTLTAFTENRCYVGWINAEESCGHADEAHARATEANAFYAGTMSAPLHFLNTNEIAAVLVWPDDKMSPDWLAATKTQLEPEFTYFNCQGSDPNQAGIFLRKSAAIRK